jgi:hypothetical protein
VNGLIIRSPHIEKILEGKKTWEIRGTNSKIRGRIAPIRSGSGLIVGTCALTGVIGPLTLRQLRENARNLGLAPSQVKLPSYDKPHAWVLADVKRFRVPRPYKHPQGAVTWVKLPRIP